MVRAIAKSAASCPDGWRMVRLGDVVTLQRGVDLPIQDRLSGSIPVYGSNGILGYHSNASRNGPGVITGRSGSIGLVYYSEGPYWPLNTTLYVRDFHGNNARYIYHFLNHLGLERFTASTGVPSLNRNFVHPHLVVIPPLSEQRAIAAVLDSIDEAIEGTEAVIAATECLRDALLHQLLTRGVPGWHTEWKDAPGVGTIPADWEVVRLGEVAAMSQGGTPRKNQPEYWSGGIPFVTGADLTGFRIGVSNARSFLTVEGLHSGDTVICEPGTLLLATRTAVGLAGMAAETMGASQDITCLVANGQVDSEYLCRTLLRLAPSLQRRSRGTTIQGIAREDVASLPILLPPLPEQRAIAAVLDGVDDAIEYNKSARDKMILTKTSAADALLTGRVKVGSSTRSDTVEG